MPICLKCGEDIPHECSNQKEVGSVVESCPLKKGALWVQVVDANGKGIEGVSVSAKGTKDTDPSGLASFDPLDSGPQPTSLLALTGNLADQFLLPDTANSQEVVNDGQITYVKYKLIPINKVTPKITPAEDKEIGVDFAAAKQVEENIHVFQPKKKDPPRLPLTLEVTLGYEESHTGNAYDKDGVLKATGAKHGVFSDPKCEEGQKLVLPLKIPNGELKAGKKVWVRGDEAGALDLELELGASAKKGVKPEAPAKRKVTFKATNRISPYIKVEHLIVLRDQELWKEQRKNDTLDGSAAAEEADRIFPDATRLELSAAKLVDDPAYRGKGQLSLTPQNVTLYTEETCEKVFDPATKIDFDKLSGEKPFKLWMRGKTAGKFVAKLTMDPSNDDLILVDEPAEGELGCVELKMKLHHFKKDDVNQAIEPDVAEATTLWTQMKDLTLEQKEMTKAERVGVGRMLHVQREKKNARAKLIVEKITEDHWPEKARTYKILVDLADGDKKGKKRSGELKLFDKDKEGTEKTPLPMKLDFDTIKAADQTCWVEGTTACTALRGIRVSLGFDRDEGGPEKKKKLDADWGTFTVINIKEVKCDVGNEANQEKFVDGTKLFINLDANGRLLKSVNGKRKAEVTATIEPAIKDVDLYFQIVEHQDNYAITDLPDDFKEKKISKLKQSLKAKDRDDPKKLLHMSAKTDDQGKAKIETLETPQVALLKFKIGAYILQDPNHARFIPEHADLKEYEPVMSSDWLEVWRRLFFRVAAMKRFSGPSYVDRFEEGALVSEMAAVGIEFEKTHPHVEPAYKKSIPDNDTANWVRSAMGVSGGAARTQYLALMDSNRDGTENVDLDFTGMPGQTAQMESVLPAVFDSANGTNWLNSVNISYDGWSITSPAAAAGVLSITQSADFKYRVDIDLSARFAHYQTTVDLNKANDFLQNVQVQFSIITGKNDSGMSWDGCTMVFMRNREQSPQPDRSATHTFLHEIGHYLGLGCKKLPDTADTLNPQFYDENFTNGNGHGGYGQGPHCDGLGCQCILWYSFKMTHTFCKTCLLALRARALHSPDVEGRDAF